MIPLSSVPEYVLNRTGIRRSRQCIYLWVHRGVKGTKLQVEMQAGQMFTKAEWLETFLAALDRRV
jgi:hypothetical protein